MVRTWMLLGVWFIVAVASVDAYTDNGNGTVTNQAIGLMWQKSDDNSPKSWQDALDYCNGLTLGGYSNWRLPNIKELRSIIDDSRVGPTFDPIFAGNTYFEHWSSTSCADSPDFAWLMSLSSGGVGCYNKTSNYYVRCVR